MSAVRCDGRAVLASVLCRVPCVRCRRGTRVFHDFYSTRRRTCMYPSTDGRTVGSRYPAARVTFSYMYLFISDPIVDRRTTIAYPRRVHRARAR